MAVKIARQFSFSTAQQKIVALRHLLMSTLLAATIAPAWAVDINLASPSELDALSGVGPKMLERILDARKQGPFKDWEDVSRRVSGMGVKTVQKFQQQGLSVGASKTLARAGQPAVASVPVVLPNKTPVAQAKPGIALKP